VHRMHSPAYVVEQVERLVRDHGIGEIQIVDDLFNFDNARVEQIFSGIVERGLRVAICIPNGIRADRLPDRTLELMRKAGVYRVMFAVETASGRLQKLMRKEMDFTKLERAVRKADELGMMVHGNFIIGLPTETPEEARRTVRYAERSRIDTVGIYRAIPFKGSDLYRIAAEQGVPVPEGESTLSFWDPQVNLSRTPTAELNRLKKDAYRRVYLRPERIVRLVRKLPNRRVLFPFLFRFFLRKALRDD
jgi:anaerobic magnesium-protoporphyrin IX monomethyl ester cyclase